MGQLPESIKQIVMGFIERAGTCREGADNYPEVDYFVTSDHVEVAICPFIQLTGAYSKLVLKFQPSEELVAVTRRERSCCTYRLPWHAAKT